MTPQADRTSAHVAPPRVTSLASAASAASTASAGSGPRAGAGDDATHQTVSPRVFSGVQPTGAAHLGNFLGAFRQWVDQQDQHDALYCIVDLHAITVEHDAQALAERTLESAAILLACGLDPERCTLFVQSHVPAHTELTWMLNAAATVGELRRMTQFKAKGGEGESVLAGLLNYPVLMAADVLLYQTDLVPIGDDQRQHLELTREIARRFNSHFGSTFKVPEMAVPKVGARVMDLQDPATKMSKSTASDAGRIGLLDPPDVVRRKVRTAVTDSGREIAATPDKPAVSNLLDLLSAATGISVADLESRYVGRGYRDLKDDLGTALVELLMPIQERYHSMRADEGGLRKVLAAGAARARALAAPTVEHARERLGFLAP